MVQLYTFYSSSLASPHGSGGAIKKKLSAINSGLEKSGPDTPLTDRVRDRRKDRLFAWLSHAPPPPPRVYGALAGPRAASPAARRGSSTPEAPLTQAEGEADCGAGRTKTRCFALASMSSAFELTQSRRTGGSETGPVSTCVASMASMVGLHPAGPARTHVPNLAEAGGRPEIDLRSTCHWRRVLAACWRRAGGVLAADWADASGWRLWSTWARTLTLTLTLPLPLPLPLILTLTLALTLTLTVAPPLRTRTR